MYEPLATYTLLGLCALWLPSAASSSGNLHEPAKPQASQTTSPAMPQHPVQAPPNLLLSVEATFDFIVPHGMRLATHTLEVLYALGMLSATSS